MSDLVERLSDGKHPVELSLRPERSLENLKERIDMEYIHVRFTGTRGGTELGVPIDRALSKIDLSDVMAGSGSIKIVGRLKLDYKEVRCVAEIDLSTLEGVGWLEPVDEA